nr:hypothetical protein C4D60_Mb09t04730 [Ipomoea batatas]
MPKSWTTTTAKSCRRRSAYERRNRAPEPEKSERVSDPNGANRASQPPPAAVVVVSQGNCKVVPGKLSGKQSPPRSSKPSKKSSSGPKLSIAMFATPNSSSSSSNISSLSSLLLSCFSGAGGEAPDFMASPEVSGWWAAAGFWRVLPASEFRWVGIGWLCSAV